MVGSIGGPVEAQLLDHLVDGEVVGEGTEVAHGGHLGGDVPVGGADDEREQGQALGLGQAAGDAEVEQRGLAGGEDEEVAGVQVAVEDAVQHGALEEADHAVAHDLLGVDAGRPHAGDVGEVEAVDPLHDEHAAGDEGGVGTGHDEGALPELGEDPGHAQHVVGLEAEVELLEDGLGEELDQGGRVGQGGHGDAADEVGGHPGHHGQVLAHPAGHRGALHLDDDGGAVAQGGRVDLGDGGGGQRGVLDRGEDLVQRAPQLLGSGRARPRARARPGPGRDTT